MGSGGTAALTLERVAKHYGPVEAVRDLSFSVERGAIFGFLGPNGAGKTTTLRMVLGLAAPTAGRITVLGSGDVQAVQDRIGFLPEERGLYKRMKAADAVAYFARLKGVDTATAKRRAREALERLGLGDAADRPVKQLSKGMAQKVQLVAAVAHEPELVFLDEPFSGLDPVNQQVLEQLIRDLAARGATVVFSTHVMQHAERLCERLVLLSGGRKAFEGTVAEAKAAAPRTLVLEGALDEGVVRGLPGVAGVTASALEGVEGRRLEAALRPGVGGTETLKAAFAAGLDPARFDLREPSLHDAFITITERADTRRLLEAA